MVGYTDIYKRGVFLGSDVSYSNRMLNWSKSVGNRSRFNLKGGYFSLHASYHSVAVL